MTRELTYLGLRRAVVLRPLTRLGISWFGRVYGFTIMPPMPPDPADAAERGLAVRHLFAYARSTLNPILALAPEGMDMPGGILGWPPPGGGRVMLQLARNGFNILPVGAYEGDGALCLSFGPSFRLEVPPGLPPSHQDREASRQVMQHIARQLPGHLRGEFAD